MKFRNLVDYFLLFLVMIYILYVGTGHASNTYLKIALIIISIVIPLEFAQAIVTGRASITRKKKLVNRTKLFSGKH